MNHSLLEAVDSLLAAIRERQAGGGIPLLVALDGGSGAGKSTLAQMIARTLNAAVIPGDDFYAATISNTEWEARTPEQRAADAIDWRRLRAEALVPLIAGKPAKWHPFDFDAPQPDGTYAMRADYVELPPADLIVLDGIYSTRAELADLIDLAVLVDVPLTVRHARLAARENPDFLAAWHARWDAAEAYYLTHLRPKSAFDLIVMP